MVIYQNIHIKLIFLKTPITQLLPWVCSRAIPQKQLRNRESQ